MNSPGIARRPGRRPACRALCRALCLAALSLAMAACASAPVPTTDPLADGLILVAGASGRAGRYVVAELTAQDLPFRPMTRSRAEAVSRLGEGAAGLPWVEADVRDPARVRAAMAGVSHVICVIGANQVSGPNGPEFVDYGGVRNLVDGAVAAGVRHFVLLTAIGVTDPAHPFNKATRGALEWRFKGEEYLRQSGLSYTIVRPAGLVNEPGGQLGIRIAQGDDWRPVLRSTLSRADLARVLVASLREPGARNATFEVLNDRDLPPDAWPAALAALAPDP